MALRALRLSAAALPLCTLLATVLLPPALQAADTERCARKAKMHMTTLPLPPDDLKSMRIIESFSTSDNTNAGNAGIDAWIQLKSCPGWLIVNMSSACFIRQSYTRGECHIEGLPNY